LSSICAFEISNGRFKSSCQIILEFVLELERRGTVRKKTMVHVHNGQPHNESVWSPAYEQKRRD
jgi:hypothetical protein